MATTKTEAESRDYSILDNAVGSAAARRGSGLTLTVKAPLHTVLRAAAAVAAVLLILNAAAVYLAVVLAVR